MALCACAAAPATYANPPADQVQTSATGGFDRALDLFTACQVSPEAARAAARADVLDKCSDNMLPAPEAEFSRVWGTKDMGNKWSLSVTQSFDWPGLYRARARALAHSTDAVAWLHAASLVDARARGRELLLDVVAARRRMDEVRMLHDVVHELEATVKTAYDNEEVTVLDYKKIKIEHIRLQQRLRQAEGAILAAENQVRALCGRAEGDQVLEALGTQYPDAAMPPMMTFDQLRQADPAVAASQATIESMRQTAKAEKLSRLPGFSLGYVHEKELGGSFNGFSVGVSLPTFANRHKARASELRIEAAQTEQRLMVGQRRADMLTARARAQEAWAMIEEARPLMEHSDSYALLHAALEAGQITMLDYVTEVEFFLEARLEYQDKLYNYHLAVAQLRRFE